MKVLLLFGIAVLLFAAGFTKSVCGQVMETSSLSSPDKDICDFSARKPLKEPHALLKTLVKKVNPKYPLAAKSVKVDGKVIVRILVNKKGDVADACVVEGHPLLQAASIRAAKQWKFMKNFGFAAYKLKERFAETELIFNFGL